jgi:SCY1-like protein 2
LKTLRESNLQLIPNELKETLKLLLNSTPNLRPTAAQCTKVTYFDDIGVKTLANLDSQFQWDNLQKSQFYKGLPQVLPRLPHRVAVHRVVPCLAKEFINPHMIPFVLPSVLAIAQEATNEDFVSHILPFLKSVMKITDPVQVRLKIAC